MYVGGFSQGYHQGVIDGMGYSVRWNTKMFAKTHCTPAPELLSKEEMLAELNAEAQEKKLPFYGDFHTNPKQISDVMSVFYADYRNMPICWENALRFSAASLAGRAPTEQELDAARKTDAESSCK
jgi:hypothetical protein